MTHVPLRSSVYRSLFLRVTSSWQPYSCGRRQRSCEPSWDLMKAERSILIVSYQYAMFRHEGGVPACLVGARAAQIRQSLRVAWCRAANRAGKLISCTSKRLRKLTKTFQAIGTVRGSATLSTFIHTHARWDERIWLTHDLAPIDPQEPVSPPPPRPPRPPPPPPPPAIVPPPPPPLCLLCRVRRGTSSTSWRPVALGSHSRIYSRNGVTLRTMP